jgi:hypothetical protein
MYNQTKRLIFSYWIYSCKKRVSLYHQLLCFDLAIVYMRQYLPVTPYRCETNTRSYPGIVGLIYLASVKFPTSGNSG